MLSVCNRQGAFVIKQAGFLSISHYKQKESHHALIPLINLAIARNQITNVIILILSFA